MQHCTTAGTAVKVELQNAAVTLLLEASASLGSIGQDSIDEDGESWLDVGGHCQRVLVFVTSGGAAAAAAALLEHAAVSRKHKATETTLNAP